MSIISTVRSGVDFEQRDLNPSKLPAEKRKCFFDSTSLIKVVQNIWESFVDNLRGLIAYLRDLKSQLLSYVFVYCGPKDYHLLDALCCQVSNIWASIFALPTYELQPKIKGYERDPRRFLTEDECKALIPIASMTASIHTNSSWWLTPYNGQFIDIEKCLRSEDLQEIKNKGFVLYKGCLVDWDHGTKIQLIKQDGRYYLGFGDASACTKLCNEASSELNFEGRPSDWRVRNLAMSQLAGAVPENFKSVSRVVALLKEHLSGHSITLIGQCWGGALASFAAIDNDLRAVGLNSFGLGPGLQTYLGKKLDGALDTVTHVFVDGDWTQNLGVVSAVDWVFSRMGFRTAGCFGRKYLIPSAYSNFNDRHNFFLGSLMASLGFNCRTTPPQLQDPQDRKKIQSPQNLDICSIR